MEECKSHKLTQIWKSSRQETWLSQNLFSSLWSLKLPMKFGAVPIMLWKTTKTTISLAPFASKCCSTQNSARNVKLHIVRTASTNGTNSKISALQQNAKTLNMLTYTEWWNRPWTKEDFSVRCQGARNMFLPTRWTLSKGKICSHSRLGWPTTRPSSIRNPAITKLMHVD